MVPVPCSLVMNTDPSWEPGEHWIAVHIDKQRHGIYFDSYGRPPCTDSMKQFLKNNCHHWEYNEKLLQNPFLSTCGQFCIYFLTMVCHGYTLQDIVQSL